MKKKYVCLLVLVVGIGVSCCVGEEFIKTKIKKVYVSVQQYIELEGDIIASANVAITVCADLLAAITRLQKEALRTVNDHVDSEKDCFLQHADKVERTDRYAIKKKINTQLERCNDEISKMQQRIADLVAILELTSV